MSEVVRLAVTRDGAVSDVQTGPPPAPALIRSIGPAILHRLLARLPRRWRYLVWHAVGRGLVDPDALADMCERAERNMATFAAGISATADLADIARTHAQELRNDYCMVLSGAADMYRARSDEFVRLVGHEAFLHDAAAYPTVLLGNHISAYHSAVIALAAYRLPIHMVALKPPANFQRLWSHFEDLGRLYGDPVRGPSISTIFVPDPAASIRILRALRKREPVWVSVDTDIGSSTREGAVPFLGGSVAPPRALYKLALREGARFYTIDIDRSGSAARPWEHRFVVTIAPVPAPTEDLAGFHQERLDAVSKRIRRKPARWTLWRYWIQGTKAP